MSLSCADIYPPVCSLILDFRFLLIYSLTVFESTFDTVPAAIKFTAASTQPFTPMKATRNGQTASVGRFQPAIVEINVLLLQKSRIMQSIKNSVLRSAVARDATKYGAVFILPLFFIALNKSPESQPHRILGTMQVIRVAAGLMPRSSTPKAEAPKHWIKLVTPKIPPRIAPAAGPKIIAPMAIGRIIKVISMGPALRYPRGVYAKISITATSMAICTIFCVRVLMFFICFSFPLSPRCSRVQRLL